MTKKQKKWLIIAIIIVILLLIIIFGSKKEPAMFEEDYLPEGFDRESLEDMEAAPEIKVEKIIEPVAIAPGASKVTQEGQVVTEQGTPAVTAEIVPDAPEAPKQSDLLTETQKEEIAGDSIQLTVSLANGFTPSSFKVKPGQAVTIVLTGEDSDNHIFRFKDPGLRAVAISISGQESRAITFNAPSSMGVYDFICGLPDHRDKETGSMIVTEE